MDEGNFELAPAPVVLEAEGGTLYHLHRAEHHWAEHGVILTGEKVSRSVHASTCSLIRGMPVGYEWNIMYMTLAHLVLVHCRVPCLNQGGVVPYLLVREFTTLCIYCFALKVTSVVVVRERHVVIFNWLIPVSKLL